MRPPGFIVKSASDLCPNILLRIRFRFLFSTLFSRDTPPFPTRETRKCGYRCRLLAVGFSPFFAITRQMDLCSEFHRMGITAAFRFPNVLCAFKRRAKAAFFHFAATPPIFSFVSIFSDLAPFSPCRTPLQRFCFRKVRERLRGARTSAKYANSCAAFVFSPLLRYSGLGLRSKALGYPPSSSANAAILSPRLSYLLGKYA